MKWRWVCRLVLLLRDGFYRVSWNVTERKDWSNRWVTDECDGERETGSSLLITWSTMKMTLIGLVMMISAWFSSRRKGATAFSHTRLPKPACFFLSSFFLFFSCRLSFYWANFLPRGLGWFQTPWSFCPIFVVDGFQSAVMEICHIKPIDDSLLSSLGSMWSRFFSAFIFFL